MKIDQWLIGGRCNISAELISIGFCRTKYTGRKSWVIRLFRGVSEIHVHLFRVLFVKQYLGGIIRNSCLIYPEQDQSPETNLRMFKFDDKLI